MLISNTAAKLFGFINFSIYFCKKLSAETTFFYVICSVRDKIDINYISIGI